MTGTEIFARAMLTLAVGVGLIVLAEALRILIADWLAFRDAERRAKRISEMARPYCRQVRRRG